MVVAGAVFRPYQRSLATADTTLTSKIANNLVACATVAGVVWLFNRRLSDDNILLFLSFAIGYSLDDWFRALYRASHLPATR